MLQEWQVNQVARWEAGEISLTSVVPSALQAHPADAADGVNAAAAEVGQRPDAVRAGAP